MKAYPVGNLEFLEMISSGGFDEQRAGALMTGTDFNRPVSAVHGGSAYSTTYLYEAVSANNLSAVDFLLNNGADPNLNDPGLVCECALWDLQYIDPDQDWKTRYEIAKLLFEHGADPYLECYGETLYEYVQFKVYNDVPNNENDEENLEHLYKLLLLYGRRSGQDRPEWKEEIDLSKIDEYDVRLQLCEDGYHIAGRLVDGEENEVGLL